MPHQWLLHGRNRFCFFEDASIPSWFPTWIDADRPLKCRPTVAIARSALRNLRRRNEVGRLRHHGIAMMQAAQTTERLNSLSSARGWSHGALGRRILGEPEVRSVIVVILDVLAQEAFQMALVQNDHMIQ